MFGWVDDPYEVIVMSITNGPIPPSITPVLELQAQIKGGEWVTVYRLKGDTTANSFKVETLKSPPNMGMRVNALVPDGAAYSCRRLLKGSYDRSLGEASGVVPSNVLLLNGDALSLNGEFLFLGY